LEAVILVTPRTQPHPTRTHNVALHTNTFLRVRVLATLDGTTARTTPTARQPTAAEALTTSEAALGNLEASR